MKLYSETNSGLRRLPSRRKFVAAILITAIFIGFVSSYVFIIVTDVKVPYLNPPDPEYTLTMPFWYPNIPTGGGIYFDKEIYVAIILTYKGDLVERKQAKMEIEATCETPMAQNITYMELSFEGATVTPTVLTEGKPNEWYIENYFAGAFVGKTNGPPKYLGMYMDCNFKGMTTMTWLTEGYYAPTLTVHYNDSSTVQMPLPRYTVHVYSTDILRQEQNTKVNNALSLALFAFAIVSSTEIAYKIWQKREKAIENWERREEV